MNLNTIWISSVPRSGSMWLFNVTREILKTCRYNVFPNKVTPSDKDFFLIFKNQSLMDQNYQNKYVMKVHNILKPNLPRSKILTTIRDPRDICISFKEFMRSDFVTALGAAKEILDYENVYKSYDRSYLKFFKYEEFENNKIETILEISKFIESEINIEDAIKISLKFNKENIKNLIKNNDKTLSSKIKNKKKIKQSEIVYFSKNNYRSFDEETGFQTNHISKRKSGDWKNIFSSEEIEMMKAEFKYFLDKYNYQ